MRTATADVSCRRGSALIIVLLALLLISALTAGMIALSTSDTLAAANYRDSTVVACAAEAAAELASDELVHLSPWDLVFSGAVRSVRVDGPPTGTRILPDGQPLQLEPLVNEANCGLPTTCTPAQVAAVTGDRPWGANNPHWRLFAHGLSAASASAPPVYTIVLVADDPQESDGDPGRDGAAGDPGAGLLLLRATAFGLHGARASVEVLVYRFVAPTGAVAARVLSWRHPGQP
jgi:hypothetical protein